MQGGRRMRYMVDLYSGLGGASESMIKDKSWSVLRIDNNPLLSDVPNTIIDDVPSLVGKVKTRSGFTRIDLIWASPPCTEFSGGFQSPKSIASRKNPGLSDYTPNMKLVEAAKTIIDTVQPKYWVIENVIGSIRYIKEILGEPRQIIGPYALWGNFPYIGLDKAAIIPKKYKDTNGHDPLRANRRAKVDLLLSMRLKEAIENQKSILDYTSS